MSSPVLSTFGISGQSAAAASPAAAVVPRSVSSVSTSNDMHAMNNLHRVDKWTNGFAIYRSGAPSQTSFSKWCELGVSQVVVLAGDAASYEEKYHLLCPSIQVVYNEQQDVSVPLTASFLRAFDNWVTAAQKAGKVILFRCDCGCHRAGRLAGYYQMKYLGYTYDQAYHDMMLYGEGMQYFPYLADQLKALQDYIHDQPCQEKSQYCVINK